ncbi:MAG: histidine ammonia-lyase, partial [Robiginitalea sp.]
MDKKTSVFAYGEDHLTAGKALELARGTLKGTLTDTVRAKVRASAKVVAEIVERGAPVYGI